MAKLLVCLKRLQLPKSIDDWPEWIVDRLTYHIPLILDGVDYILDFPRSVFAPIFSRKLPR
jgi:hypothetical protein